MKTNLVLLFLTFQINLTAQKTTLSIERLNTWHSYPVPNDSAILWKYGDDTTSWSVFSKNGEVYAVNTYQSLGADYLPFDSIPDNVAKSVAHDEGFYVRKGPLMMSVDDGYLIAINRGEWGGHILWYSEDGKQKYKISGDEVIQFFKKDGHIYAVEGLLHLDYSAGSLIELVKEKGKWTSIRLMKLPFAPFGLSMNDKGDFVIATSDDIVEINDYGRRYVLYCNPVWNQYNIYLYPRSMLFVNKVIYIGMRKGVFKYDLNTGKQEWLMKD